MRAGARLPAVWAAPLVLKNQWDPPAVSVGCPPAPARSAGAGRASRPRRCPVGSLTEVGGAHLGIVQHLFGVARHRDRTGVHDVATVGRLQREAGVLLD